MTQVNLRGRSIAITGASSGIGAATAIACARAGMHVAIMARRAGKLAEVAIRCREAGAATGSKVLVMEGDVADAAACKRLVDESVATFGMLYAVYANAGYGFEKSMVETSEQELRRIFEVNFFGTMNLVRPAVEYFMSRPFEGDARRRPRGHVLICSSCLAKMTLPRYGAYSATKAAQSHIGRAMRHELEPKGIAVSTVNPISTSSEFFDTVRQNTGVSNLAMHTPGFWFQTPEKVARCTVDCLVRPEPEVWTGVRGRITRLGTAVCTLLPFLPDLMFRKMARAR